MQEFRLEDLALPLPTSETEGAQISSQRGINGQLSTFISQSKDYALWFENNTLALQFEELLRNPAFATVPLADLDRRITTGIITDTKKTWQHGLSECSVGLYEGHGTWFIAAQTVTLPSHPKWSHVIQEDFFSNAAVFPNAVANMADGSSTGTGLQDLSIPWWKESGNAETSNTQYVASGNTLDDQALYANGATVVLTGYEWWRDYEISVYTMVDDALGVITEESAIIFRSSGRSAVPFRYYFGFTGASTVTLVYTNGVADATIKTVTLSQTLDIDTWIHLRLRCEGSHIQCFVNNELAIDVYDNRLPAGRVGLFGAADGHYFDDFRCTLLVPLNYTVTADARSLLTIPATTLTTAHGKQSLITNANYSPDFTLGTGESDCILDFPMNEGEGTIIYDHSKSHINGQINGATWIEDNDVGWCLDFDGTDDFISQITLANTAFNDLTISLDFYLDTTGGTTGGLIDFDGWYPLIYSVGGDYLCFYYDWGSIWSDQTTLLYNDSWHHLTAIINYQSTQNFLYFFIDGKLVNIQRSLTKAVSANVAINIGRYSTNYFHGKLKDCRIYSAARWDVAYGYDQTPATVFCHDDCRFTDGATYPSDNYLVLGLHMDEGFGTVCYDMSGKGHDGTLTAITAVPVWTTTSFCGDAGTCLDFEATVGSQGVIVIADHDDFSFTTGAGQDLPFSIIAHIKLESHTLTTDIISKYEDSTPAPEWEIGVDNNGYLFCRCYKSGDESIYIGRKYAVALTNAVWYSVVITYDGNEVSTGIKLYINGSEVSTSNDSSGAYTGMGNSATAVLIGARYSSAVPTYESLYDGLIDEIRVLKNVVLSTNEIAARYRSEPYLHDFYSMRRVYDVSHEWHGYPVMSNGLIMVSFADYDCYENRGYPTILPAVYGWYENSWHLLAYLDYSIVSDSSRTAVTTEVSYKMSNWWLEKLTDQSCILHLQYLNENGSTAYCHYAPVELAITIQNGCAGLTVEEVSTTGYHSEDYDDSSNTSGVTWRFAITSGGGMNYRFCYLPKSSMNDAEVLAASTALSFTADQMALLFGTNEDSNAPSKNVLLGIFASDDHSTSTGYVTFGDATNNNWISARIYDSHLSGFFFVPYDIDGLHKDGYELTARGDTTPVVTDKGATLATDDGFMNLDHNADEAYWNVGTLTKGIYAGIIRYYTNNVVTSGTFQVETAGGEGTIYQTYTISNSAATWVYGYLLFYADGATNLDFSVLSTDDTPDPIYVDYLCCVPLANDSNYPQNIKTQLMQQLNLKRGLRYA